MFNSKQGGCYRPYVMTDFKVGSHAQVTRIYHFYKCRTYVYSVCCLFFFTINKFIMYFLVIPDILLLVHIKKKILMSSNQPDVDFPCLYHFLSVFCNLEFLFIVFCYAVFLVSICYIFLLYI